MRAAVFTRRETSGSRRFPARAYMEELMADVLEGTLDLSPVFDMTVGLDGVPDGYAAMDERRALKVLIKI